MTTRSADESNSKQFSNDSASGANRAVRIFLLLLAIYVFLLAGYVRMRYAWQSLEGDAISLTALSQNVLTEGKLSPVAGAYPYGYAYPTLNVFLASLIGMPLASVQIFLQPFLVVLLVPVSFIAYRSLTGRGWVALLASLLLFLSPEFLFEATRSSHAKLTWMLALTMLFILARSFQPGLSFSRLTIWVASFYLVAFALITSNSFFASGYAFGITFAFTVTYILLYLRRTRAIVTSPMRRLSYVTASSLLLVFLFMFYLYPPAWRQFGTMRSVVDQVSTFFLGFEETTGANPYTYVQSTWLSTWVYLALTTFNWFILLLSFAVWLRKGWSLLVRRETLPPPVLLLWLLYASFAALIVVSLFVDRSGALSANLQLRLFPHLLLVGIPLASEGIVGFVGWTKRSRGPVAQKLAPVLLVALICFFSLASMLKITNEPLLSNWWSFYVEKERLSVQWIGNHIRDSRVWVGQDARLPTLVEAYGNWPPQNIRIDRVPVATGSRYVLLSDASRMHADRTGETLPDIRPFQRVYDNGGTELYQRRPLTPYQR